MFVTFEGIEGSSKTTQAKLLSEWLTSLSISHILTKEPGTPAVKECQKIRELILNPESKISSRTEFFLYLADRSEHVEQCILPAIANSQWVICDRYVDSTKVYQGIGRGLGVDKIADMITFASRNIMPDITFIMDVPVEMGLGRARSSNTEFAGGDRMEREAEEFHNKLRQGFLEIAGTHERYVVLDARKSIEELHGEIRQVLHKFV